MSIDSCEGDVRLFPEEKCYCEFPERAQTQSSYLSGAINHSVVHSDLFHEKNLMRGTTPLEIVQPQYHFMRKVVFAAGFGAPFTSAPDATKIANDARGLRG